MTNGPGMWVTHLGEELILEIPMSGMRGGIASRSIPQGVVDSDPPSPWKANEKRESLLNVLSWAADSEISAPWEDAPHEERS